MTGLSATFISHVKVRFAPSEQGAALEGLLVRAWETSRERWPTVALPAEPFIQHLAERLPKEATPATLASLLARRSLAELYLACACLQDLPSALRVFEEDYLARLPALLRSPTRSEAMIEDACQDVSMKLLVPTAEGGPKLAEYKGQGALLSWMKVAAERILLKLCEREKAAAPENPDAPFEKLPAGGRSPEGDAIQIDLDAAFRQALGKAFATLSPRERYLLRMRYRERLSMYKLAALFRVNQGTISRWLQDIQERISKATQRHLQAELGLRPGDFTSFVRQLDSQFDVSLSQLIGREEAPPRPPEQD